MEYLERFFAPMGSKGSSSSLPMEIIIYEILTRTSPETVARSRAVCKHINKATYEWSFAEKHRERAKIVSGVLVRYSRPVPTRWGFENKDKRKLFLPRKCISVEAVTRQGLVLCKCWNWYQPGLGELPVKFSVCKPATKQVQAIPQPNILTSSPATFAMTVMSSSNPRRPRYKIARFISRRRRTYSCEVFDSATWQWRTLPENVGSLFSEKLLEPIVSVGGFFYAQSSTGKILAFDWAAESWNIIESPTVFSYNKPSLMECEGKLGAVFVSHQGTGMEIWVLERSRKKEGAEAWIKRTSLSLNLGCFEHVVPLAMPSSDVVVFGIRTNVTFYRIGSGNALENRVVKRSNCFANIEKAFWFESDEQLVDLKAVNNVTCMNFLWRLSSLVLKN